MKVSKNDRKLFKSLIGEWQERYIDSINSKYLKVLTNPNLEPSEKFWQLEKRIKQDKKHPGVICDINEDIDLTVAKLLKDKVISDKDIQDFSDEFKEVIHLILER